MLDIDTHIAMQDGNMVVGRSQDCTPIAEYAKSRHNEGQHGSKDMRLAGSIPYVIVEKYCNDNGIEFSECMSNPVHFKAMLNDPSLAHFRIWPGRI